MDTTISPNQQYKSVTVDVPEERLAEFHAFFARFLAAPSGRRRGGRYGRHGRPEHGGHGHRGGRCSRGHWAEGSRERETEQGSSGTEPSAPAESSQTDL
jgi:hypothetical protein